VIVATIASLLLCEAADPSAVAAHRQRWMDVTAVKRHFRRSLGYAFQFVHEFVKAVFPKRAHRKRDFYCPHKIEAKVQQATESNRLEMRVQEREEGPTHHEMLDGRSCLVCKSRAVSVEWFWKSVNESYQITRSGYKHAEEE